MKVSVSYFPAKNSKYIFFFLNSRWKIWTSKWNVVSNLTFVDVHSTTLKILILIVKESMKNYFPPILEFLFLSKLKIAGKNKWLSLSRNRKYKWSGTSDNLLSHHIVIRESYVELFYTLIIYTPPHSLQRVESITCYQKYLMPKSQNIKEICVFINLKCSQGQITSHLFIYLFILSNNTKKKLK